MSVEEMTRVLLLDPSSRVGSPISVPSTLELKHVPVVDSSTLSVLLTSNVLASAKKIHRSHFFHGQSQQRDCACRQPCTSRPLIHSWRPRHKPCFRVPLSPAPSVISERVSHLSQCTECPILTTPHEQPSLGSLVLPGLLRHLAQDRRLFALQLLAAHSRLVHPLCHHSPNSQFGPTPGRSTAPAVAVCGQAVAFSPSLRDALRMCTLQP